MTQSMESIYSFVFLCPKCDLVTDKAYCPECRKKLDFNNDRKKYRSNN